MEQNEKNDPKEQLRQNLRNDRAYREQYATSALIENVAAQVQVLRRQRGLTQGELAERIGTQQPRISYIENPPETEPLPNWELDTLNRIAQALNTRLKVSFESYGTLVGELDSVTSDSLRRPDVDNDPDLHPRPPMPSADTTAPERTRWMQERMIPWLWDGQLNIGDLIAWLQGYNLPAVGHEEEPYQWLLRGIPSSATPDARDYMERHLAEGLAIILGEQPDVQPVVAERHEEFLNNLYWTCSGLTRPAYLAEPLWEAYKRLKHSKLSGANRDALQAAIVQNQPGDKALNEIWQPMVAKGKNRWLRGTEVVGYEGIVAWHQTVKEDLEKVFEALSTISHRWEGTKDDSLAFNRMMEMVPGLEQPGMANRLAKAAVGRAGWSSWALPKADMVANDGSLKFTWTFGGANVNAAWPQGKPLVVHARLGDLEARTTRLSYATPNWRILMNEAWTVIADLVAQDPGLETQGSVVHAMLARLNPPKLDDQIQEGRPLLRLAVAA